MNTIHILHIRYFSRDFNLGDIMTKHFFLLLMWYLTSGICTYTQVISTLTTTGSYRLQHKALELSCWYEYFLKPLFINFYQSCFFFSCKLTLRFCHMFFSHNRHFHLLQITAKWDHCEFLHWPLKNSEIYLLYTLQVQHWLSTPEYSFLFLIVVCDFLLKELRKHFKLYIL